MSTKMSQYGTALERIEAVATISKRAMKATGDISTYAAFKVATTLAAGRSVESPRENASSIYWLIAIRPQERYRRRVQDITARSSAQIRSVTQRAGMVPDWADTRLLRGLFMMSTCVVNWLS